MAFVIAPEPPLAAWLAELGVQMIRSPGFFEARPVVIDFAAVPPGEPGIETLITDLEARGLSVIDVENAADLPGADPWRRRLVGGRETGPVELAAEPPAPTPEDNALLVPENVRSGQSVSFLKGDVTVVGAVSSGAEVLAGGSIHIYGTLRGRALAGALGNPKARIFCQRFEAELVSIDGFYQTADTMDPSLRGRAVEIRLVDEAIVISKFG
jgi:septum site-determining protein MinC